MIPPTGAVPAAGGADRAWGDVSAACALPVPTEILTQVRVSPGTTVVLGRDPSGNLLAAPLIHDADCGPARRAVPGDGAAAALISALGGLAGEELPGAHSVWVRPAGGGQLPGPAAVAAERSVGVDQTHDSVVVSWPRGPADAANGPLTADAAVVKWVVHTQESVGEPPAVSAALHLTAAGFTAMPEPWGFLVATGPRGGRVLLASVTRFLPDAVDGWEWYPADLMTYLAGPDRPGALAAVLAPAGELGALVAELHTAFATPWSGCPEPVRAAAPGDGARWMNRALATLAEAVAVTGGTAGERLRAREPLIRAALVDGFEDVPGTALIRPHGDLHAGQVLRWAGGYAVSDFDGNPVLAAADQAAMAPLARDLAGVTRSLDHVARIVARRMAGPVGPELAEWSRAARTTFLAAYAAHVPEDWQRNGMAQTAVSGDLLRAFEVEQECRELVYAARHLSGWTYVPDAALTEMFPLAGPPPAPVTGGEGAP